MLIISLAFTTIVDNILLVTKHWKSNRDLSEDELKINNYCSVVQLSVEKIV